MLLEWYDMTRSSLVCSLVGQVMIPVSISALLLISHIDHSGWMIFSYFCMIWTVDTMAMIGGKIIKGPKFAPVISPNKTISGLIIGVTSSTIVINILNMKFNLFSVSFMTVSIFCLGISFIAQCSDLFVSYFKRKFHIKDTGSIIPGHGGVLDRFDSIILTSPLVVILCYLT